MKDLFLKVLFDDSQSTCFTQDAKGTKVSPVHSSDLQYFCINALHPSCDLLPTQEYHNPNRPRRADVNIVCLRNILVEIDTLPLKEQMDFISSTGLPFSTCVFSGSKSFHFIISLVEPISNLSDYKALVGRLYSALNSFKKVIDTSCKNPSRLSRMGNSVRDNGIKQGIVSVGSRINNDVLLEWIDEHCPKYDPKKTILVPNLHREVSPWVRLQLMKGIFETGTRNKMCFMVARELSKAGFEHEEIVSKILPRTDLSEMEVEICVRSAVCHVP